MTVSRFRDQLRRHVRPRTLIALLMTVAVGVGGCGGSSPKPTTGRTATGERPRAVARPGRVDIYASLPLSGTQAAEGRALRDGIELALSVAHNRAGAFRLKLITVDDGAPGVAFDPQRVVAGAQSAALDPDAVYYIGQLSSAASMLSIGVLNAAGVVQVSPGSPYVGLTNEVKTVTDAGEPHDLSGSGTRTFARLLPSDAVEAGAMLTLLARDGCKTFAVAYTSGFEQQKLAELLSATASDYGLVRAASGSFAGVGAAGVASYIPQLRALGTRCVALAAVPDATSRRLTEALIASLPHVQIVAGAGLCSGGWLTRAEASVLSDSAALAPQCVSRLAPLSTYDDAAAFTSAWRARHGRQPPDAEALVGYGAAQLAISAITALGADGDSRSAVLHQVFAGTDATNVLGALSFSADGNSSLDTLAVYRLIGTGALRFDSLITPTHWLTRSSS